MTTFPTSRARWKVPVSGRYMVAMPAVAHINPPFSLPRYHVACFLKPYDSMEKAHYLFCGVPRNCSPNPPSPPRPTLPYPIKFCGGLLCQIILTTPFAFFPTLRLPSPTHFQTQFPSTHPLTFQSIPHTSTSPTTTTILVERAQPFSPSRSCYESTNPQLLPPTTWGNQARFHDTRSNHLSPSHQQRTDQCVISSGHIGSVGPPGEAPCAERDQ